MTSVLGTRIEQRRRTQKFRCTNHNKLKGFYVLLNQRRQTIEQQPPGKVSPIKDVFNSHQTMRDNVVLNQRMQKIKQQLQAKGSTIHNVRQFDTSETVHAVRGNIFIIGAHVRDKLHSFICGIKTRLLLLGDIN